jgi:hypothetical protein
METNPLYYGLPARVRLDKIADNQLAIRKVIKSRLIRKDAEKIVAMANQIRSISPKLEIALICTRNICSKSIALLNSNNINTVYVDE